MEKKIQSYEETMQFVAELNRTGNQWESILHKNMKLNFVSKNFAGYLFDVVVYFNEITNRWTYKATKHINA